MCITFSIDWFYNAKNEYDKLNSFHITRATFRICEYHEYETTEPKYENFAYKEDFH